MDGAPRSRLSTLGAIFAFLAAVVVTVLGMVPSAAVPTRQPAASDEPASAESADAEPGASVSIVAPDKTNDELQVPGPVAAPVAGLPEAFAHAYAKPGAIAGHTGESRSQTTRGRAPPC